ncbi:hypothetical protein SCHPADRAFT_910452 [Schizopora paradoxa]|uniref:Uncharacterized protein n=1 Tax=Schizopora paradoxa TaxID=27342 RepID=A0A0H2R4J9_9AGAM|nr:hypothetical protein SCHPADRAFT_910452 [Schizopora paradoxa]
MNAEAGSVSLTGNHVQHITLPTNKSHLSVVINCENGFAPTSVVINLAKPDQEIPPANGDNSRDVNRIDCTSNSKGSDTGSVSVVKSAPAPSLSSNHVGSASKGSVPVVKSTPAPSLSSSNRVGSASKGSAPAMKTISAPSISSSNRVGTASNGIGGQSIAKGTTKSGLSNANKPIVLTVDSETESCTSSDSRADFESDSASTPTSIQEVETQVMLDRLYNYNETELAEFRAELRRNGISPKSSSAVPEIEAQVLRDMKKARKNFKEVPADTMPAIGASQKRKRVDDGEVVPDSRAGSSEAIPLPLPTVSSARLNSGGGSAVVSAPAAGRYRLSETSPFRDTSPVDLDSPETRRRKVEGKRKVQERMKQPPPVGRTRGKRPVSLELVPFVTGMSASGSGPARKQTAKRGEKMVKTRI